MKREIYISADIESSGPAPGIYSMLSLGACVVGETRKRFYAELKPLNDNAVPGAMRIHGLSLEKLQRDGEDPARAMARFAQWLSDVSGDGKPVFAAFPAAFDWQFVNYYFHAYLGKNPFGSAGPCIKSYYMGMRRRAWSQSHKKGVTREFPPKQAHTHNALDDAIEQAEIFEKMLSCQEQEQHE